VLGLGPLHTSARAGPVMRKAMELSLRTVCAVAWAEFVKHAVHITKVKESGRLKHALHCY
jgi:hypothetical protein